MCDFEQAGFASVGKKSLQQAVLEQNDCIFRAF